MITTYQQTSNTFNEYQYARIFYFLRKVLSSLVSNGKVNVKHENVTNDVPSSDFPPFLCLFSSVVDLQIAWQPVHQSVF